MAHGSVASLGPGSVLVLFHHFLLVWAVEMRTWAVEWETSLLADEESASQTFYGTQDVLDNVDFGTEG